MTINLNTCPECPQRSLRSHGPDRLVGPPCCQGIAPTCADDYGQRHCGDHYCCPDRCQHSIWNVWSQGCPAPCCAAAPRSLCVVFIPDEETEFATRIGVRTDASHSVFGTHYGGFLSGAGEIQFTVGTIGGYDEDGRCYWRLLVPNLDIDERWPVDHFGPINCLTPPAITIEGVVALIGCVEVPGRIEITAYQQAKIPFVSRFDCAEDEQVVALETPIGHCTQVCKTLCVMRLDPDPVEGDRTTIFATSSVGTTPTAGPAPRPENSSNCWRMTATRICPCPRSAPPNSRDA